jgi:hypothetical protein
MRARERLDTAGETVMDTSATGSGLDMAGRPAGTTGVDGPDLEVRRDDPPVVVPDPAGRSLRVAVLVVGVVAALLVAGLGALWLLGGGDDDVATTPALAGGDPAGPAALTVRVDPPETVVAGQPATLVVHYADGLGVFSGSTEDWGDGVGAGSVKNGRCGPADTRSPVAGSYRATHTWADPGSYPVTVEVTTYSCAAGTAVEEHASTTVDVSVTAP